MNIKYNRKNYCNYTSGAIVNGKPISTRDLIIPRHIRSITDYKTVTN